VKIIAVTNIKGGVGKTTIDWMCCRPICHTAISMCISTERLLKMSRSVRSAYAGRDFVVNNGWTDLALLPFFSMVDRRKSLHHEVIASTRERLYSSEIERMSLRRAPLPSYAAVKSLSICPPALVRGHCPRGFARQG
jgi:hypothetical protein